MTNALSLNILRPDYEGELDRAYRCDLTSSDAAEFSWIIELSAAEPDANTVE